MCINGLKHSKKEAEICQVSPRLWGQSSALREEEEERKEERCQ
jgi:hypothetical protein